MSNTVSLRRTERPPFAARFSREGIATAISTTLMTIAILSFRPFQPAGAPVGPDDVPQAGGDIVNQLGFSSLGALAVLALVTFVDRRKLSAVFSPWWLLLLGCFLFSVFNATDPASAMRAAFFTIIGILTIAAVLSTPRDADAFSTMIAVSGLTVVGLSFLGLVIFPDAAIHGADTIEPEHLGFWRGVFTHKNIAGPVMACYSFAGIYLWRRGWARSGALLFLGSMVFLGNTGSKTTAALVPLAMLVVILPSLVGMRLMTPMLFAVTIIGTALATLGIVFIPPIQELANSLVPDLTYTGRTALWEFSGEMIAKRLWTGYGYESFWGTPLLTTMEQSFDRDWDIRGIIHAHNGYLDLVVIMGLPTLFVAIVAFLIEPVRDYMRIPLRNENVYIGDLFMMVVLFTALNAFLESFFFRRADPVWLFFVFGVLGLRLAARFSMVTKRA